jgi:hypothetical protein
LSAACALVAFLCLPATASAVNPVSFTSVGNLTTARDAPGVARLPDGRVLVAGGYNTTDGNLDTAEIFDPKTNSFSPIGATMSTARYSPMAASLPDGRVLIAGGYNGVDVASADVFNPSTGTFSPVGSMSSVRELAGAVSLPDGRVLVLGGYAQTDPTASTEIFDPKTNAFSAGPSLSSAKFSFAAAAIAGGKILIAGGEERNPSVFLSLAEVFNPAGGASNPVGSLPSRTDAPVGASLPGGRALVAAGHDEDTGDELKGALIFDPGTNSLGSSGIGNLNVAREEAGATELADGRVLVAGGWDGSDGIASAELLSVPSNAFKAKLKGRKVIFSATNEGVGEATDVSTKVATSAKKKKRPKLVKTTTRHGGPGKIKVKVKLTKLGAAKLAQKGKLTIRVVYTPDQGLAATKKLKLRGS